MSKRKMLKRPGGARSRAATALAVVGALIMSMGVVLLAAPTATAVGNEAKWFVCKWVSKPIIGEAAHHVISVDDGPVGGGWFNDGQSSSYALVLDTGQAEPDISLCPPYDPPGDEEIDPPSRPDPVDPCGLANIAFPVMQDGDGYDWTLLGNGDLTVQPQSGYVFSGSSQLVTFELPADSGVLCNEEIDPPSRPDPVDPCGLANIAFPVMQDGDGYDWTLLGNGDLTVQPQSGYVFSGSSQLVTFELPADSGVLCNDPQRSQDVSTQSEQQSSCVTGVEARSRTVTTSYTWNRQTQQFDASVSYSSWSGWSFVRSLTNAEFEQLGCRPDQPSPVEVLGSETRVSCAGIEERESTQATTFVWNEATRSYDAVVGDTEWSDWAKARDLTDEELLEEGCVLGEETVVPKPKPTVKGVQRVAPPAAVPTAVAAGFGEPASRATTQLLAQMLVGGGMLLLLAGGWIGFGRREGGAHEV